MSKHYPRNLKIDKMVKALRMARFFGDKTYQLKEPCNKGHLSPRSVASGLCLECAREQMTNDRHMAQPAMDEMERWKAANG